MRYRSRTLVVLLFVAWLVPGLAAAQRKARLVGKIVDQDGKPLEGVTVTATSPELPEFQEVRTTARPSRTCSASCSWRPTIWNRARCATCWPT